MPTERFKVRVTKDHLVFCCGHFISFEGHQCERLHGHNYRAAVEVEGPLAGDYYVFDFVALKARMKETGAQLAGEMSGHFFFAHRWLGFDDGLYAGARLLELLSHTHQTFDTLVDELPVTCNTPELREPCPDAQKNQLVARLAARLRENVATLSTVEIDGVRASFAHGWILVRASTTQPVLVMRIEASSPVHLANLQSLLETELALAKRQLGMA